MDQMSCTRVIENGVSYYRINRRQPRPRRPLNAEEQQNSRMMAELWESNPELIKSEIAKFYKRHEVPPLVHPEIRKKLKADILKITGPTKVAYTPATDLSVPTCVTRDEDDTFKSLANAPTHEAVFEIINPKTSLPDETLKAFVIKRYREGSDESNETMVTVSASDEVPGARVLKRRREDLGESSEIVIADSSVPTPTSGITDAVPGASVLKRQREDLDEVLEASVLKCRREDLVESRYFM